MEDRLIAGALAGIVGATAQNIYSIITKAFGVTDRGFMDYAEVLITNNVTPGKLGFIVGFLSNIGVGIIYGIVFSYIILLTSGRYYLPKGVIYGFILWILLTGFGTIFNLPQFGNMPHDAALVTLVGSLFYGFFTAYTMKIIDERSKLL